MIYTVNRGKKKKMMNDKMYDEKAKTIDFLRPRLSATNPVGISNINIAISRIDINVPICKKEISCSKKNRNIKISKKR